jgi:hypothetical protein
VFANPEAVKRDLGQAIEATGVALELLGKTKWPTRVDYEEGRRRA